MKINTIVFSAALLFVLSAPPMASAQSGNMASLFDQANQMNNEEQDMAKELKSKAGDNQALVTLADTMRDDHKDNQTALEALASQKNVKLKSYEKNKAAEDQLDNLKAPVDDLAHQRRVIADGVEGAEDRLERRQEAHGSEDIEAEDGQRALQRVPRLEQVQHHHQHGAEGHRLEREARQLRDWSRVSYGCAASCPLTPWCQARARATT